VRRQPHGLDQLGQLEPAVEGLLNSQLIGDDPPIGSALRSPRSVSTARTEGGCVVDQCTPRAYL